MVTELIGKEIVACKAYPTETQTSFILLNDGETFIELEEQDYYTFHDCSSAARMLCVRVDKDFYAILKEYPDAIRFIVGRY